MIDMLKQTYDDNTLRFAREVLTEKDYRKADYEFKRIVLKILDEGTLDKNPRPKYEDGTPAHTISINHEMVTFNISKGEFPIITLRPIPFKSAIGEILWIYKDASNNLDLLFDKYGITWWDSWDIGNRTIGCCYGETVRRHNLMNNLLDGIKNDEDGRRHIMSLWQEEDFKYPHGLKPCCFLTNWAVRHEKDGDYLDMCLYQRSADFAVGVMSNWVQYGTFLILVAKCLGYKPGKFTWFANNVQIYDRHINQCIQMLRRSSVACDPHIELTDSINNFFDIDIADVKLIDYDRNFIASINPQLKFEIGI